MKRSVVPYHFNKNHGRSYNKPKAAGQDSKTHTAHAAVLEEPGSNTRPEGATDGEESDSGEPQLSAASNGPNQQGAGRGGRGGRGRGGAGAGKGSPQPETRTCFICQKVGHIAWKCPNKAADVSTQPQSNE